MILSTDPTAAPEVGRAALMEPHHHIDPAGQQRGEDPVRAEEPVGQEDVAGLELLDDQPEQGQLAGLLALIRADGGLEDRAHGEAEDHEDSGDREPDAGLLGLRLGIRRLILGGIRHGDGRAVGDLDGSPSKEPGRLRPSMDRTSGLADEVPEDHLGQARSGLAVAGGVGRDGG
jgi:hypothetical protein